MSAEVKDFQWICGLLVAASAGISVVETLFLHSDDHPLWVYTSKSAAVKRRQFASYPSCSPLSLAGWFLCELGETSQCTMLLKPWTRASVDLHKQEDLRQSTLARCFAIQQNQAGLPIYTVRLDFRDGSYQSRFIVTRDGATEEAKSCRVWLKALSTVKVVIGVVERLKKRAVTVVEAEFLASPDGDVRLCGVPALRLQRNPRKEPAARKLEESRLNSRIMTPTGLRHCADPYTVSPTPSLPDLRKSVIPFINPNFQELLALNFAKGRKSRLWLDVDTLVKDLDAEIQRSSNATPVLSVPSSPPPAKTCEKAKKFTVIRRRPGKIPQFKSAPVVSPQSQATSALRASTSRALRSDLHFSPKPLAPVLRDRYLAHRRGQSLFTGTYYFKTVDNA